MPQTSDLGEIGANFSLLLSSRKQFAKINNKKVIAKNQCEKHKKSSLVAIFNMVNMSFIRENKILPKISEFTVYSRGPGLHIGTDMSSY